MDRFFISSPDWTKPLFFQGEEAHHCTRVMRKKAGEIIEVFDGEGRSAKAEITEPGKERVSLRLLAAPELSGRAKPEILLAVGIPKGKTMDLIIQKSVELGVNKIQPLLCEQGMVKTFEGHEKREKWQRMALEACKQCGQNFLPEVCEPLRVAEFLGQSSEDSLNLVAALTPDAMAFSKVLRGQELKKVTLMIGPEGDFSAKEYEAIFAAHFSPIGLGDLVLRVETAVLYAISVIHYEGQTRGIS